MIFSSALFVFCLAFPFVRPRSFVFHHFLFFSRHTSPDRTWKRGSLSNEKRIGGSNPVKWYYVAFEFHVAGSTFFVSNFTFPSFPPSSLFPFSPSSISSCHPFWTSRPCRYQSYFPYFLMQLGYCRSWRAMPPDVTKDTRFSLSLWCSQRKRRFHRDTKFVSAFLSSF